MIPYLDEGHPDGFPVVIDFSAIAVEAPGFPGFQYRDEVWMTGVFQRVWEFTSQAQYLRLMTHYPDYQREGRWILPGGMVRVNVVPNFHWAGSVGGYTPQPLDRWMHWYQTVDCYVNLVNNTDVGAAIVHELGHVFFPSVGHNPMHTAEAGTIFLAPPPANPTINAPYVANAWGGAFANYYSGLRYGPQGQIVVLPMPAPPLPAG